MAFGDVTVYFILFQRITLITKTHCSIRAEIRVWKVPYSICVVQLLHYRSHNSTNQKFRRSWRNPCLKTWRVLLQSISQAGDVGDNIRRGYLVRPSGGDAMVLRQQDWCGEKTSSGEKGRDTVHTIRRHTMSWNPRSSRETTPTDATNLSWPFQRNQYRRTFGIVNKL